MYVKLLLETGHHVPIFIWMYFLCLSIYTCKSLYVIFILISMVDYIFMGPMMKYLAYSNSLGSIRPILYQYAYHLEVLPPHMNGMPSGHAEVMWLLTTLVWLSLGKDSFETLFIGFLALFVSLQRILTQMHDVPQVLVGGCVGGFMGMCWYILLYLINVA